MPLRPKDQPSFGESPSEAKPAAPPGAPLTKAMVTVYETSSSEGAAPSGVTPAAMMEHFVRENAATIAAIDVASGKSRVVASAEGSLKPSCARLSPDGKWVSFLTVFKMKGDTASETYYDLAVVPAAGGTPVVLAADLEVPQNNYFEATYRWIPGTSRIAFWKDKKVWLVDAAAPGESEAARRGARKDRRGAVPPGGGRKGRFSWASSTRARRRTTRSRRRPSRSCRSTARRRRPTRPSARPSRPTGTRSGSRMPADSRSWPTTT